MGTLKDATGTFASGLTLVASAFFVGAAVLLELGTRWSLQWQTHAIRQSGIFCYRGIVRGLLGQETTS